MRPLIKQGTILGRDAEKVVTYIHLINHEKSPITVAQGGAKPQSEEVRWQE